MSGIHGPTADLVELRCLECKKSDQYSVENLNVGVMAAYRVAMVQDRWRIAGYETPKGDHKRVPKMLPTWHCSGCSLIEDSRIDESRIKSAGDPTGGNASG